MVLLYCLHASVQNLRFETCSNMHVQFISYFCIIITCLTCSLHVSYGNCFLALFVLKRNLQAFYLIVHCYSINCLLVLHKQLSKLSLWWIMKKIQTHHRNDRIETLNLIPTTSNVWTVTHLRAYVQNSHMVQHQYSLMLYYCM